MEKKELMIETCKLVVWTKDSLVTYVRMMELMVLKRPPLQKAAETGKYARESNAYLLKVRKRYYSVRFSKKCFANAEETPYLQMAICGALHIEVQCSPFSRAEQYWKTELYVYNSGVYKPAELWQAKEHQPPPKKRSCTMVFMLKEMEEATNMFSDRNLDGKGGFGQVYRGVLKDGQVLACLLFTNRSILFGPETSRPKFSPQVPAAPQSLPPVSRSPASLPCAAASAAPHLSFAPPHLSARLSRAPPPLPPSTLPFASKTQEDAQGSRSGFAGGGKSWGPELEIHRSPRPSPRPPPRSFQVPHQNGVFHGFFIKWRRRRGDTTVSVPEPVRRPQKPKTASKWPTDMIEVTEIHPDGKPIEVKQQRRLRLLARLIARQQLSLVMPSFKNLTDERKWELFNKHVMPYLKFPDTMKTEGLKYIMKVISKSWRTHKNRLVTDFIEKNLTPFQKHPYIQPEDWAEFEVLKKSPEEIAKSEKYKMLRQQNVHNHCQGSAGYDGKEKKWEVEDAELVKKGIPNPWDDYPEGRPVRFLRASSKLEPGRVRAVSSYTGWKHGWPGCSAMYIKRKRSGAVDVDVQAIAAQVRQEVTAQVTQEVTAKVTKEVTSKVTQDVMSYLVDQGLLVRPPSSRTPSPACGRRSSCASASNAVPNDLELGPSSVAPDTIDLLEEPTQCSLVVNLGNYRPVVAEGRVLPKEFVLESVQIDYDYAIVQVECVHQGYEDYVLQPPPNDDIKTLREALLQRIQWRRDWILVKQTHETQPAQSQPDETTKSAKSVSKGTNAIISTKLLCGANSTPSNHQSPATSDATKSVPKEHNTANPSNNPNSSEKECTKLPTQPKVGTEAVGSGARPPKQPKGASKAAGESEKAATNKKLASKAVGQSLKQPQQLKWIDKYKCGHPFLPAMDLKVVGPGCTALHAHYMKDCVNNKHGIVVRFRGIYMLNSSNFEVRLVRYNFLSLVVEAKAKDIHVGFLDPQVMSLDSITFDRDKVLQYVQKAFTKYTKNDYIMFAYNSGGLAGDHWIVVCLQQSSAKSSGWYAAHHLFLAMRKTNLEYSEEFEVLTTPIDMLMIREKLARFLVEQVIEKKGEFHHDQ
ncbi:unnamed protein product [Miscanthus lutarioriparius]|uniref:DUF8039 domain-containing protein n=1 Tax=Miscanthus lutarioriparius TaxID=422564 RepID=A0A811PTS6_9POAL|nr:unnamed protein product [Miscanthus lutarioriparius]